MKIQDKITAIRRLLTELEAMVQLDTINPIQETSTDRIYAIIKECQPIHKRGITRKTYSINHKERDRIITELCFKKKIIAIKQGKRIVFITQDHPSKAATY